MTAPPTEEARIEAIVVNHNTSRYTELAVRSLISMNRGLDFGVTVVDNASDDAGVADLERYLLEQGIPFVQSGFSVSHGENTHGESLARFVLENPTCSHYLFLDTDTCFRAPGAIAMMKQELDADPGVFAVHARTQAHEQHALRPAGSVYFATIFRIGRPLTPEELANPDAWHVSRRVVRPRCDPYCALVKNTPQFRLVAQYIGLSTATINESAGTIGGFYDTFGLASQVMKTHGQSWRVSHATVFHFFGVTRPDQDADVKIALCLDLLQQLRRDPNVSLERG